ncbi:hypothetical protein QA584_16625 [Anaerocolumna sp. AGMB13025]|uniref:hypothetical protein n=1 Tax=Anaerocolumna sp. AGMB13025 TaxID=3039116 RepID=UPI00241E0B13|nr:hypothetical protein [Anaerocolumna sp. AGMB13025]WFR55228.1 hypothetical protein QA584_16625 [Anaerocolumna sp. AGMB13025]
MLKLMKYEFRKQAFSKLVILALIALFEIAFFYGVIRDNQNMIGTVMGLLIVFTLGALFFLAFESIITYSNDLKQKCSYMLFLTPNTSYSIVGAKVLSAGIQIILAGAAFFALFVFDAGVLIARYDKLANFKKAFLQFLDQFYNIQIDFSDLVATVCYIIALWIFIITLAFFSITLSTTFLANKKYKGIVSFIIFMVSNYLYSKISNLILDGRPGMGDVSILLTWQTVITVVFILLAYFGTAWMLEKKVSV